MSAVRSRAVSQYAATSNLTARMALHAYGTNPQDWFSWLDERLPRAGELLEVGAGTGELWRRVGRRGAGLTLADFSPAMCARLRTVPDARVVRGDAARLPFAAAAFDTVVANHMLYHLDDPDAALAGFARVLRPGGRLAVAVNGPDHMAELAGLGVSPAAGKNDFDAVTGPARVASVFREVTVERYPCDLDVPAAGPVLDYLASAGVPFDRRAAGRIVEARIRADGAFRIRKHTVLILACR